MLGYEIRKAHKGDYEWCLFSLRIVQEAHLKPKKMDLPNYPPLPNIRHLAAFQGLMPFNPLSISVTSADLDGKAREGVSPRSRGQVAGGAPTVPLLLQVGATLPLPSS